MDTLEEKLLEKIASCHSWRELLNSAATSAGALCFWVEHYNNCNFYDKLIDKNIQKNLFILELHIQLFKKLHYPNNQEIKKQILQETAKKYDILDNN